jgi:PAS domain S-box-containing protein
LKDPERDGGIDREALVESAEELYEYAPCGYLTTTTSGRIVKVNQTFADWLGCDREKLLSGLRLVDVLTPGGRIFYETHLALLLRVEDRVNEIALDFRCEDGSVLPALVNARQKRNSQDQPVANRYTVFDARERRKYERQLLAARDLFETTLSSIGDGVISTDSTGMVTFINPVAAALTGWDPDMAAGKPIEDVLVLVRESTGEKIENPIRHALRTGCAVGIENHTLLVSKDGRTYVVDDSAAPIRDDYDSVSGAVMVFRDISPRRRAERALEQAYAGLEQTAAELRRSNEDLSQFAYVASHDLRSPLKTVMMFSQLLERQHGDKLGDAKELLGHIKDATLRMASLIEDLLHFSTISAKREFPTSSVDANEGLRKAVDNLRSSIAESGAIIEHDALPNVGMDQTSLVQLFQNLIGNAIRYRSAETPRIRISAVARDGFWHFSCSDNGIGIAAEYKGRIFEPFKRLHGPELPGSGIGLAVCKKIVQRYGGDIWVESTVGEGSTFYFTVPIAANEHNARHGISRAN